MIIKVEQRHIDAARKLYRETGAWRSPLQFALDDAFENSPLERYEGRRVLLLAYDQFSVSDVKVYTSKDGSGPYRSWLKKIPGQVETPQSYLLHWDFTGTAKPAEFEYVE